MLRSRINAVLAAIDEDRPYKLLTVAQLRAALKRASKATRLSELGNAVPFDEEAELEIIAYEDAELREEMTTSEAEWAIEEFYHIGLSAECQAEARVLVEELDVALRAVKEEPRFAQLFFF